MKKLFLLTIVVLLASSCTCLLSQIPPQTIPVNANCQAILPDYLPMVPATDNCGLASVVQIPEAGYILDVANQSVEVTIRATDLFGNFNEVSFMVTAVDTIKPVLSPIPELLSANWDTIHKVYDVAERLVAEQEQYFDEHFDWEAAGIPEDKRPINQYDTKMLSVITSPAHAKTGYGSRVILFKSNNDEFIVK